MNCFIRKIFEGNSDEGVHAQFQKFSKGNFTHRALIKASASAKGFSLSAGPEYANEIVRMMAQLLGESKTRVTGVIVSTQNLKDKIQFSILKQFMGIKQYGVDDDMTGWEILRLLDALPDAFFALSFSVGETVLKIKAKAPKSAKPKTSEEPPKPDFCSVKAKDASLIREFAFDAPQEWKSFAVSHTFVITDIEIPQGVTDLNEIRKKARRVGKVIRKIIIDGKEFVREKEFVA